MDKPFDYENSLDVIAARSSKSTSIHDEKHSKADPRSEYQHDRDRIIHSRAFRRLLNKTQVFVIYEGDHFRTRLTHTLEVSQISRTVARALNLNEDLTEAIALGHDIGHTPFGHIGEDILHQIMGGKELLGNKLSYFKKNDTYLGGFKHNWQSLRVLDKLERKYSSFEGLNLTNDTREGILKHSRLAMKKKPIEVSYEEIDTDKLNLENDNSTMVEGQIVKQADEIAQRTHDLEDGFRSGVIEYQDIETLALVEQARKIGPISKPRNRKDYLSMGRIVRSMINILVCDLVENSSKLIQDWKEKERIKTSEHFYEKRKVIEEVVNLSLDIQSKFQELDATINDHIINSERVNRMDARAVYFIKDLFEAYFNNPRQLPSYLLHRYENFFGKPYLRRVHYKEIDQAIKNVQKDKNFIRMICDHIAGMTDSFALSEHQKLYLSSPQFQLPI